MEDVIFITWEMLNVKLQSALFSFVWGLAALKILFSLKNICGRLHLYQELNREWGIWPLKNNLCHSPSLYLVLVFS